MSHRMSFGTGCLLSLVVLVARHGFDIVGFFLMVCLLLIVYAVVSLGQRVYNEHKTWFTALWTRLYSQIPPLPKRPFTMWKWRGWKQSRREKQMFVLQCNITALSDEMKALSLSWHQDRDAYLAHRLSTHLKNQPSFTPTEPHQAFVSEYLALTKALTHLGTPAQNARLKRGDLDFYSEWLGDLTLRFHAFRGQYIQQQKNVNRALNGARAFQEQFGTTYQPMDRFTDYWISYGSYSTLEDLLKEGCVQPESLLPIMQTLQSTMESLLARQQPVVPPRNSSL